MEDVQDFINIRVYESSVELLSSLPCLREIESKNQTKNPRRDRTAVIFTASHTRKPVLRYTVRPFFARKIRTSRLAQSSATSLHHHIIASTMEVKDRKTTNERYRARARPLIYLTSSRCASHCYKLAPISAKVVFRGAEPTLPRNPTNIFVRSAG